MLNDVGNMSSVRDWSTKYVKQSQIEGVDMFMDIMHIDMSFQLLIKFYPRLKTNQNVVSVSPISYCPSVSVAKVSFHPVQYIMYMVLDRLLGVTTSRNVALTNCHYNIHPNDWSTCLINNPGWSIHWQVHNEWSWS